ncbi:glycosyltransferase family 9 protein [Candidatus Nucleicultrix amoebiphila]|jgi:ADP-heptose:LPS heptosyltransferase|uniref:Glycosyl transferase n=1 Tax=Candidatus Nucleicultrix amoebiphila FS5 TaxID=1414854 RepID=A0A1W6N5R2_9PROT|nr:glycosyltransferase family 9 protein [Candidatus Nucleicultrix amoebiphila]ARN85112.1 hypothetical protein GQ61_07215 [Candidatus Nucleicultrix amoebiphila FS5]
MSQPKILFITSTRIGDAVLSTGILNHYLSQYPNAALTIACGEPPSPLFTDIPNLEKLIVLRNKRNLSHWLHLWRQTFDKRWDLVVDLRGSILAYILWAGKRVVWRSIPSLKHRVTQLGDLIKVFPPPAPSLMVSERRLKEVKKWLPFDAPIIALSPAANWPGKEWPQEHFSKVLNALIASDGPLPDAKIAFFAAPHERQRVLPLLASFPEERVLDFMGKIDLLDVAALFKHSSLFIGNDSGLMHMAAAVGTPTLGLFGPSRSEHYAPFGVRTAFIRTPEPYERLMELHKQGQSEGLMSSLKPEDVFKAAVNLMKTAMVLRRP